jgi:hypothetical protein
MTRSTSSPIEGATFRAYRADDAYTAGHGLSGFWRHPIQLTQINCRTAIRTTRRKKRSPVVFPVHTMRSEHLERNSCANGLYVDFRPPARRHASYSISPRSGLSLSGSHDFKQPARATNRLSKTSGPKLRNPRVRSLTNSSRVLIVLYSARFKKAFMIGFIHSDLPENVAWSVPGSTHSCA